MRGLLHTKDAPSGDAYGDCSAKPPAARRRAHSPGVLRPRAACVFAQHSPNAQGCEQNIPTVRSLSA